jgi:hypothetical protein
VFASLAALVLRLFHIPAAAAATSELRPAKSNRQTGECKLSELRIVATGRTTAPALAFSYHLLTIYCFAAAKDIEWMADDTLDKHN